MAANIEAYRNSLHARPSAENKDKPNATCDNCHVMAEIEPKRERGVNAHKKAVDEQKSCIECHYNEKHRPVDLREDAFGRPEEDKLAKVAD